MGPSCCPKIVGRIRTVQQIPAIFLTFRPSTPHQWGTGTGCDSYGTYLSEGGRLDAKRGAERGTAEQGKEGRRRRGKERHAEHLRIPFLTIQRPRNEKGRRRRGWEEGGAKHFLRKLKSINRKKWKISRFGVVVRVVVRPRSLLWLFVGAEASILPRFLTLPFPSLQSKLFPLLCYLIE